MLRFVAATLVAIATLTSYQNASGEGPTRPTPRSYGLSIDEMNEAFNRGEGKQALAFYAEEAERLLGGHETNTALIALSRGMIMAVRTGELERGLGLAARARDVIAASPPQAITVYARSSAFLGAGIAYKYAGRVGDADRVLRQGLVEAKTDFWRGVFSNHLGELLERQDPAEAIKHLRRAVDLFEGEIARERAEEVKQGRMVDRMPRNLNTATRRELATALQFLTSLVPPDEAAPLARRALEIARWLGNADAEIRVLNSLGRVELRRQRYGDAERRLREALAIATRVRRDSSLIPLHADLARSYRARGRLDEALGEFERSLAVIESVRSRFQRSAARGDYVEDKQALYQAAIVTAIEAGRVSEAFTLSERARARAFLDLLGTQTSLTRGRQPELAWTEARVLGLLPHPAGSSAPPPEDEGPGTALTTQRDVAVAEFDHFVSRVRVDDHEQASLLTVTPVSAAEVQVLLPADTAIVEFMVLPTQTVVWIIHKTSIEAVTLPIAKRDLVAQIEALRGTITNQAPLDLVSAQAEALHALVFKQVRERLRVRRVVLAPHDVMHYLPFAALRTPAGRWLVEDYILTTVPSASVLRYLSSKGATAPGRALVVGNPDAGAGLGLPFAELEARMVAARYPEADLLLRRDATKAKVRALAGGAGVLHFATHAELRADDPMASALVLSAERNDPGRLEVREIFKLDLNARLVVLSACQTGLGKRSEGDELIGLQRAFLYAGTPAVVSTLWKVADRETFELMTAFYRELATQGAAEALRAAQLDAMRHHPHPFAWAAFGLAGLSK